MVWDVNRDHLKGLLPSEEVISEPPFGGRCQFWCNISKREDLTWTGLTPVKSWPLSNLFGPCPNIDSSPPSLTLTHSYNYTSKKLEILEINLRQFFGFSANLFAENAEPFKFALCLETALPIFSKLCSDIA